MPLKSKKRRVCFVTGTRAEFGLMRSTLHAIREHSKLQLQLIVTGSHLSGAHGKSINAITAEGWKIDETVAWDGRGKKTESANGIQTGRVMAKLAGLFEKLGTDVVVVVGDRVEAFAAAAAGHISGRIVAHIHGGDRALGQVDDALRHAITKLAHVHFPATAGSAKRLVKLGEEHWRIHRAGSPGVDGIVESAAPWTGIKRAMAELQKRRYALLVLHPTETDEEGEYRRAKKVLNAIRTVGIDRTVIVYPNNDPGYRGIIRCWDDRADHSREIVCRDVGRDLFLGLMRDAAVLVGNSSSGIIEAASFGTPVIDIEPRQHGRERNENVATVSFTTGVIKRELHRIWNSGMPIRYPRANVYGGGEAGQRIATALAGLEIGPELKRKLIAY